MHVFIVRYTSFSDVTCYVVLYNLFYDVACFVVWVLQKEEAGRLLKQTEQQVSILKASLERATKAKEHAEAQVSVATPSVSIYKFMSLSCLGDRS